MATTSKTTTKKAPAKATKAKKVTKATVAKVDGSFAVIKTGGKQYKVAEGDTVTIEVMKGDYKVGDKVTFDEVLLTQSGETTILGTPFIKSATVAGEITAMGRNQKVTVIKYKQKSRYFKKNGHRQPHFKVKITQI